MRKNSPIKKLRYLLLFILLSGAFLTAYPNSFQNQDSVLMEQRLLSAEDLIRGERLFYGLAYVGDKSVNCAGCHNTRISDTLNWNPNALEISLKYHEKNASDLTKVLLMPSGQMLRLVHKDFDLSTEDIVMVKAYMDELVEIGLIENKPIITNLLLFIIASVLFLFSVTDLIITRKVKKRWVHYLILLTTMLFMGYTLSSEAIALGRSLDYSPFQPVKFSHAVHAGQNATDCIYCHSSAPISKTAGIPPENVCMICHLMVRNGTRSGTWEITKLTSAFEKMEPIQWIKVYNLPDHVFFSHSQHVSAGGLDCQDCHGNVNEMDVIEQVTDMSMGWCLDCHRSKKVNFADNVFYSDYMELTEKMKEMAKDSVTVEMIGGRECMKCHY